MNFDLTADFSLGYSDISVGGFVPFANLTYEYDYQLDDQVTATAPQPANDKDDVVAGIGPRYYSRHGFTASFEYNTVFVQHDQLNIKIVHRDFLRCALAELNT